MLFVLSGLTSLVYEVLWLRGFAIVLGSTLESLSSVLTAFMLGLALGSATAGRVLRTRRFTIGQCLFVYGLLELGIGLYGLAFTTSLFVGQDAYLRLLARVAEQPGSAASGTAVG